MLEKDTPKYTNENIQTDKEVIQLQSWSPYNIKLLLNIIKAFGDYNTWLSYCTHTV